MLRPIALTLLFALATPAVLSAQGELPPGEVTEAGGQDVRPEGTVGADGRTSKGAGAHGDLKAGKGKGQLTEEEEKAQAEALARMPLEERLARTAIRGAKGQCRIDVHLAPTRWLPGQTGTIVLTMLFEGDAVMPAPAKLSVRGVGGMPDLTFGAFAIDPARPGGRLAKTYAGVPVYDNWATIRVPATLASNVPLGQKKQGTLELTFDLYQAATGQPIGRFIDTVNVVVEAGDSPDPAVVGAGGAASAEAQATVAVPPEATKPAATPGKPAAPALPEANPLPATSHQDAQPVADPATAVPAAQVDSTATLLLGLGVLVLFAVVGLLLFRRR